MSHRDLLSKLQDPLRSSSFCSPALQPPTFRDGSSSRAQPSAYLSLPSLFRPLCCGSSFCDRRCRGFGQLKFSGSNDTRTLKGIEAMSDRHQLLFHTIMAVLFRDGTDSKSGRTYNTPQKDPKLVKDDDGKDLYDRAAESIDKLIGSVAPGISWVWSFLIRGIIVRPLILGLDIQECPNPSTQRDWPARLGSSRQYTTVTSFRQDARPWRRAVRGARPVRPDSQRTPNAL